MKQPSRPARTIDAAIELIIPDNTAFTVLTALQGLGYEDLVRVERAEHFFLTVGEAAAPESVVDKLSRAEIIFNPNKHRLFYSIAREAPAASPSRPKLEALVFDNDDNTDRLAWLLANVFAMKELQAVERAVGWRMTERNGPASRERLEWACRTLLCNAVSQHFDIRPQSARRSVGELSSAAAKDRA